MSTLFRRRGRPRRVTSRKAEHNLEEKFRNMESPVPKLVIPIAAAAVFISPVVSLLYSISFLLFLLSLSEEEKKCIITPSLQPQKVH